MADLGTVDLITLTPMDVTGQAIVGIDHGTVDGFTPCDGTTGPTVPTTGQLWPRGNP